MTNPIYRIFAAVAAVALMAAFAACDDNKSYAEQLAEENKAVNRFLADHHVIDHIPADSVFEIGADAPYYCIDSENSIYMQVLNPGDSQRAYEGQVIYFRSMRYPLSLYYGSIDSSNWSGNADNMLETPSYFKFDDISDYASQTWGTGLQQPLYYLGLNCEVNLVIKSNYGPSSEIANVTPYLWNIRYFPSQM